ncbi:hypothetical protein ACJJTC_005852 [Scirpophaga incertulas]
MANKMKESTLILLAVTLASSTAYLIRVPTAPIKPRIATPGWVHIQKLMLPLFENVCEASTDAVIMRLANEFTLDGPCEGYSKPDVLDNLRNILVSKGFLAKDEIFSEYNSDHMKEFKALYEILSYANDFDTFYKAACWARQNTNCALFLDAVYLAVLNRRDTAKISIPAPYELLPNYFIRNDVVIKASSLLNSEEFIEDIEGVTIENNAYIINTNYTSEFNTDEDSKLAYFREDVGLNSFYYLRKLMKAPWFNTPSNVTNNYGEYMYLFMKQLAARYDLERYSQGLTELESINWDTVIDPYDPMLMYSNGAEFSHRTWSGTIGENDDIVFLRTVENNLDTVVTHLIQAGYNKSQMLNHLIEIFMTADKNYETIARKILSSNDDEIERQYSAMEHYLTTMRDPVYWRINKKMVELIDKALSVLPPYTRSELYFPGVEVLGVEAKKMLTSFDNFIIDVTDSLKATHKNTSFQVKISQARLNHKPFTLKFNISSLVAQKGFIKLYIGPKTLPGQMIYKKNSFVLMDCFEFNLKSGINVISRSSTDMNNFSNDLLSLKDIRKKVEDSEFGLDALPLKYVEEQVKYPARLILPQGSTEGLPLQLFVIVAPFYSPAMESSYRDFNSAILSPSFPFDLDIDSSLLNLPNVLLKDIVITHKNGADGNKGKSKKWNPTNSNDSFQADYSNGYSPSQFEKENNYAMNEENKRDLLNQRPAFTYKNSNSVDYSAKRNQYKSAENYGVKTTGDATTSTTENPDTTSTIINAANEDAMIYQNNELQKETNDIPNTHKLLRSVPAPSQTYTSTKKDQYIKKKTGKIMKNSQYKIKSFRNKSTEKPMSFETVLSSDSYEQNLPSTEYNNYIMDTILENTSDNNEHVDKTNTRGSKYIVKEIFSIPQINKMQSIVKKSIDEVEPELSIYSNDDDGIETDLSDTDQPLSVPEIPKRRVTVYDYLFKFGSNNDEVYE